MNIENLIERFCRFIISHKIKTLIIGLVLIILTTSGVRFLETPSGYRAFVENDFPQYQKILNFEEKYGMIDTLSFLIKPEDGTIFQKDVLQLINDLTDVSWQTPYSTRVSSLTNYQHTTVEGDDLNISDFIENVSSLTESDLRELKNIALQEKQIVNFLLSENARVTFVNISLDIPLGTGFDDPIAFADKQKKIFNEKFPNIKILVAGSARFSHNFQTTAQSDAKTMYPGFLILIIFLAYVLLRSVAAALISLIVIFLSILPTMGTVGWMGFEAQPPLIIAPIIILTIALAHSIHILSIALTNVNEGMKKDDAIVSSIKMNFVPVFLTSFTTAVGMAGVNFGKIPAISDMANAVVIGSSFSFLIAIIILPVMFMLLPIKPHGKATLVLGLLEKLSNLLINHKYYLIVFIGIGTILLSTQLPKLYFDDEFDAYFDRVKEWKEVKDIVNKEFGSSFFIFSDLPSQQTDGITSPKYLEDLEKFSNWLESLDEVAVATTVADVIKTLNQNMNGGNKEFYVIPENKALNAQYFLLYEFSVPYGMDLKNQITQDKSDSRILIRMNMFTSKEGIELSERVDRWLENNMPYYKSPGVSGIPIMMPYVYQENTQGLMRGLSFSFTLIILVIGITLRSLRLGLISIVPNIIPFILAYGVLSLFTHILTFSHTVAVIISIGLVVDATIHFMTKFKSANNKGLTDNESIKYCFKYVGYPIIIASVCLFSGFLFLLQSDFMTNYILGGMCALIILIALLIDLLILPALLLMFGRKRYN